MKIIINQIVATIAIVQIDSIHKAILLIWNKILMVTPSLGELRFCIYLKSQMIRAHDGVTQLLNKESESINVNDPFIVSWTLKY